MKGTKRQALLPAVLYTLYIFAFLLTEFTVNERCAAVLGDECVTLVYAVGIVCSSFGCVCFYFSRRLIKGELPRKLLMGALVAAYMLTTLLFMFSARGIVFICSALTSLLLLGCMGGFTHYAVSLFLLGKGCSGRLIGASVAAAVLLQFMVQNLFVTDAALIASLIASVLGVLYIVLRPVKDWLFENPLPYAAKPTATGKTLALPVCIVAVMSLCHGLGDGVITRMHAVGALDLSSYSRLLYAAGALLAGAVSDLRDRRLLPLCTLCLLVFSSSMALFIGDDRSAAGEAYVGAVYLFSGFYVLYLTVTFLDAAPRTARPELWAGMGRIVRGASIGLTAAVSGPVYAALGRQGFVIAGVCLSLVTLVLFVADGGLSLSPVREAPSKDRLPEFAAAYNLTPRETDVLKRLLGDTDTNADIARELAVSVRVLQRYVASIYEKTGVSSRVGLVKLYYNN